MNRRQRDVIENYFLLRWDAVYTCISLPTLQMNMLIVKAAGVSESSVNVYQTARRHTPEDSNIHSHCRENFQSDRT